MTDALSLRHYSPRTREAYVGWVHRDGERRALGERAPGCGIVSVPPVPPVPPVLAGALDVPRAEVQLGKGGALMADLVVRAGGHAFLVDVLDAAAPGLVAARAEHVVTAVRKVRRKATPLLAVPYMTEPRRVRGRGGGRTHSTILLAPARDMSWVATGSFVFESKPTSA